MFFAPLQHVAKVCIVCGVDGQRANEQGAMERSVATVCRNDLSQRSVATVLVNVACTTA
jgi:hypothetical protein